MKSSLREQFEQTAQDQGVSRPQSSSPERVELRWECNFHNTIDAIKALRDCGLTLFDAKMKIEELMTHQMLVVDLPTVADKAGFIARIAAAGATARIVTPVTSR